MTGALVVGADRLGNLTDLLKSHNIKVKHHISGREVSHQKRVDQLPSGTSLVILLTDFLGHNVMKSYRCAAQKAGVQIVCCRRSKGSMQEALARCGFKAACATCPNRPELQQARH
ncbi:hypothetical protein RP300_01746 [Oligella urethralis]|uniref:Uncharacterized protein conserved in bacteria (DUF2325) n=1 Tax=Oligella urethralis TaxID=90245 RepID=A0A2N6QGF0_9BURK|nr:MULTISPECIES: DUF2325 domain-containing protein [Oligella]OFV47234.1 hypothetical protein HMPREF3179_08975 [Oligella sp. HMSC09E12]PMC18653.1 DUF2325 domain-containing protein [Oligella urethralis]WOS38181.1 hypothetical protein RP300_01746 [Oligella urethralis]SPY07191.1 Uncharacterized protein conserved in bacteria (DUF2325) [Oligella urethralis]SUA65084.1 Uncharacterized protein conserved in bacteria (DUF2325) [Oligella urethralis]